MSAAQISTLFLIWSTVGIVAEVPSGALADRFSRRAALVAAGVLQAAGYVLWLMVPDYAGFAAGFGVWAVGGAFGSGAAEALLYDGLAAVGAEHHYPRLYGRFAAVGNLSQLPAAAAATLLFATGGYDLVGWVSVGCCLAAAAVASRLPEARQRGAKEDRVADDEADDEPGYFAVLRSGMAEAARHPAVRAAVVAVAVLGGLDGLEEYFPLLAHDWGLGASTIPLALLGVAVAGAAGAALGGAASRLRPCTLAAVQAGAVAVFGGAALLHRPVGVVGIAVAYGLYQAVLIATESTLQSRIEGPARATVTSVAAIGTELGAVVLYGMWALNQPLLVAAAALAMAAGLPRLLRPPATAHP